MKNHHRLTAPEIFCREISLRISDMIGMIYKKLRATIAPE